MGLTVASTGKNSMEEPLSLLQKKTGDRVIALAGNPNVGKSTVFNALTGMNQHTGNWPGKTVSNAQGICSYQGKNYIFVDIPGTYSLLAHSAEEEVARDFICFGRPDAVVVVCDATCLERNLNLVLQTMEITRRVIVCVNLMDEAGKKHIEIDLNVLSSRLGVPVIGASAREGKGLDELMKELDRMLSAVEEEGKARNRLKYLLPIEQALDMVIPPVRESMKKYQKDSGGESGERKKGELDPRWISLKLLDTDIPLQKEIADYLGFPISEDPKVAEKLAQAWEHLELRGIPREKLQDKIVSSLILTAEDICQEAVRTDVRKAQDRDRKIDKILTSKGTGIPIMLLLLILIFWITITGANYPSRLLSQGLFWIGDRFSEFLLWLGTPLWLHDCVVSGIYRVLAWVVSVMLPPMAIFFPLFTLLEDLGYLPRVAFNLDRYFKKAGTCGKQALTTCMGFGCNAAGVVGCRIIDSPRERLIATMTNSFVPCNGRFPTIITIISMFFVGFSLSPVLSSLTSALFLSAVIVLGIFMTFFVSGILSKTLLKGVPSSFTLELPPYRRPQIGKVIVRSIFDRTLFVLGRAAAVAAPAGLLIWIMANVTVGDATILSHCSQTLDPFARLFGLDGVILLAFILGFPANEIVLPIILMAYLSQGTLVEMENLTALHQILLENGWTWVTAFCTVIFSLMHWPCSTTCLTIRKETRSWKWTLLSMFIPTAAGLAVCFVVANTARLLGMV